jgi:hypothetical protein
MLLASILGASVPVTAVVVDVPAPKAPSTQHVPTAPGKHNRFRPTLPQGKREFLRVRQPASASIQHETLAKAYEENAGTYLQVAQVQRDLLAVLKASPPPPTEEGRQNVERMEMKSRALIQDAEKLATDARQQASFHRQRAKELSPQ